MLACHVATISSTTKLPQVKSKANHNFYFSIIDTPRHLQSSIDNIILLASIKTVDFKSSSANTVLKIIVDELKDLWENGINFKINQVSLNVKVCMAQISGDNLGLHSLLYSLSFLS